MSQLKQGPWSTAPWAVWFTDVDDDSGKVGIWQEGVMASPFSSDSFMTDVVLHQPGAPDMPVDVHGRGIMEGGNWPSDDCADQIAQVLGGTKYDGRLDLQGGFSYSKPLWCITLANGVKIGAGDVLKYFYNGAGPIVDGSNADYLNDFLQTLTSGSAQSPADDPKTKPQVGMGQRRPRPL